MQVLCHMQRGFTFRSLAAFMRLENTGHTEVRRDTSCIVASYRTAPDIVRAPLLPHRILSLALYVFMVLS